MAWYAYLTAAPASHGQRELQETRHSLSLMTASVLMMPLKWYQQHAQQQEPAVVMYPLHPEISLMPAQR